MVECPLKAGWVIAALLAALLVAFSTTLPGPARADEGSGDPSSRPAADPRYTKAVTLIGSGSYADAIDLLKQFVADKPKNADGHNMLGYATRKMGKPAESLPHYREALRLNPKHRGAHEYLGEAYLQLGQLDKAKEHLAFLDDDCWLPCEEYSDLKEAIARYEARHGR